MTITFKDLTLREGSQVPGLEITDDVGKRVLEGLARVDVGRVEVSFPAPRRARNCTATRSRSACGRPRSLGPSRPT